MSEPSTDFMKQFAHGPVTTEWLMESRKEPRRVIEPILITGRILGLIASYEFSGATFWHLTELGRRACALEQGINRYSAKEPSYDETKP